MPELSGIECLTKLRCQYSKVELPIIMMTADDASHSIVKAFSLGINDYILKGSPITIIMSRINFQLSILELTLDRIKLHELQAVMALIVSYNHEINNPLTIAIGNLSSFKKSVDTKKYEKVETALWKIAEVMKNLNSIRDKHKIDFDTYADNSKILMIKQT